MNVNEDHWVAAKNHVAKTYPTTLRGSDEFWALVKHVYMRMQNWVRKGKAGRLTPEQLASLQWEPPGGGHPGTWRAKVGNDYVHRTEKPGRVDPDKATETFTEEEMKEERFGEEKRVLSLREATIEWGKQEHLAAARAAKDKATQDFHMSESQRKVDLGELKDELKQSVADFRGTPSPSEEVAQLRSETRKVPEEDDGANA